MTTRRAAEKSGESRGRYYELLEVAPTATEDELRRAFRRLARRDHPDRNPGDPAAAERFKEIVRAYEVLLDPRQRALYDEFDEAGLARGFDAAAARLRRSRAGKRSGSPTGAASRSVEDTARTRPRGALGAWIDGLFRRPEPERGKDIEIAIQVDLLEALRGTERTLALRRPGLCPACQGTGTAAGGISCAPCRGSGSVETPVRLRAKIPAGVASGARVRLEGQGGLGRGGAPSGDLWMAIRVAEHPLFDRIGDDLMIDVPITVAEAVRGATIAIPTPEGSVNLRIPPGTQSGRRLRLRGKGAPRLDGGPRGDLFARILIQVPEASPQLEAIAESLEPLYADSFRNRFAR